MIASLRIPLTQELEQESGIPLTQKEIVHELRAIHRILEELEERIGKDPGGPAASIT